MKGDGDSRERPALFHTRTPDRRGVRIETPGF